MMFISSGAACISVCVGVSEPNIVRRLGIPLRSACQHVASQLATGLLANIICRSCLSSGVLNNSPGLFFNQVRSILEVVAAQQDPIVLRSGSIDSHQNFCEQ